MKAQVAGNNQDIGQMIGPYFDLITTTLANRTPASQDRIRKFRTLCGKVCDYFHEATTYADLNSMRRWREFIRHCSNTLSRESLRISIQDINVILDLMWRDEKIGRIRLKTQDRQFAASEGFHVEKLLEFTAEDVRRLRLSITQQEYGQMVLMFDLTLCSFVPVTHLVDLRVKGVKDHEIHIHNKGLVCSVLLDPGYGNLLRYIAEKKLAEDAPIFSGITPTTFNRWLLQSCKKANTPQINAKRLFYFSRFLAVLQGVPAYAVACLGSNNGFSPFTDVCKGRTGK